MGNTLFVVWRESLEAMLIVGILAAWVRRQEGAELQLRGLWAGVAAGVAAALALGWAMVAVQDALSGEALELFQAGMLLVAAALITQMVLWMQRHGRGMRRELEARAARAAGRAWGVGLVAALAIAREGAETAVFLYGAVLEQPEWGGVAAASAAGAVLAAATAWTAARGLRLLNMRLFFALTGGLLLLFAAALLVGGLERLIGMGWLPPLVDPLWSTDGLLDDGQGAGKVAADLLGYRAHPPLLVVLAYAGYWTLVWALGRGRGR